MLPAFHDPFAGGGALPLEAQIGRKLTVIAWFWVRTVKSPNAAFANVEVPLASTLASAVTFYMSLTGILRGSCA